jgi:flagellar biosynthesis protein FlhF
MRVSTYFAATLPQAMTQVRDALGPKAIVLSWRNVRGGVEISASVQGEQTAPRPQASQKPIQPPPQREELLANHFKPDDFGEPDPWTRKVVQRPAPQSTGAQSNTSPPQKQRGLGALVNRPTGSAGRVMPPQPRVQTPAPIRTAATPPTAAPVQAAHAPTLTAPVPSQLKAFLMRAGLNAGQALVLGNSETPELRRALTDSLAKSLRFEPIEAIPPKPILLVGPPGAGKSACAAKLAARTLAAGHEVLLISADAERCGGSDQLAALAKRLGTRFTTVTTLVDLNQYVGEARQRGMVVYVDAPSACPAQPADMRATARMIAETRLEPVLCIPADMRPDDMEDLALAYVAMGVKRAIATRLDLTTRRASVLHVLQIAQIALAQVSATPYISGGVAIATPARVAAMLLEPFEDALFEGNLAEDAA